MSTRLKLEDHIGATYNNWTVARFSHITEGHKRQYWVCRCECGKEMTLIASHVVKGVTKRCGSCAKSHHSNKGPVKSWLFGRTARNAEVRGIPFLITIEDVNNVWFAQDGQCALSKVPLVLDNNKYPNTTASLDRIDSKIGYVTSNVWWIHKTLNNMKSDLDLDVFLYWCRVVAERKEA